MGFDENLVDIDGFGIDRIHKKTKTRYNEKGKDLEWILMENTKINSEHLAPLIVLSALLLLELKSACLLYGMSCSNAVGFFSLIPFYFIYFRSIEKNKRIEHIAVLSIYGAGTTTLLAMMLCSFFKI